MARGRKRIVAEKDYDALIKASEEKIEKLLADTKAERANLKQLKKDKEAWEVIREEREKQEKLEAITKLIAESGKSLDEIKEMLS